jgi:hypothetical protein
MGEMASLEIMGKWELITISNLLITVTIVIGEIEPPKKDSRRIDKY